MTTSETQRRSPYQSLIPYDEKDAPFFFGREKETRVITANLFASRLTLLYGASGVGKSSVLQAGVAHHLRPRKDLLVVVFNTWQNDPLSKLRAAVAKAAAPATGESDPLPDSASLAEYLAEYSARLNCRLMIILDQFEEYFLYHGQQDSQGTFDVEFPRAVNRPGLRVNFLISIRQDALAELDRRFKGRITNLFNNRLEVKHLSREAARDAIEKPKDEYNRLHAAEEPVVIEEKLIEEVLRQVETGQVVIGEAGRGVVKSDAAEPRIETPYLQLVMTRLWEEGMRHRSPILRLATLDNLGGAKRIVQTHLDAAMNTLPLDEQDIAAAIFLHLVTPSGTKIAHIAPDLAELADVDQTQLSSLVEKLSHGDTRILRTVAPPLDRPDTPRYEIFHDVLAPAILDWRSRYVQAQELRQAKRLAASEAAARERETARQRELEQAQSLALEQQRRAEAERQRAEEQEQRADTERLLKEEQRQRAKEERQRAEENARAARNRLRFSIALGVLLVVTIAFAGLFLEEYRKARASEREAVAARSVAEREREAAVKANEQVVEVNRFYDDVIPILYELLDSGNQRQTLDRFNRALKVYRRKNNLKGEGVTLATRGDFYHFLREDTIAQKDYEDALPILENALGSEHYYVATIRDRLATVYSDQGNYAKAEALEEQALTVLEKVRGPEHPDVVSARNNLALIYLSRGKYARAESLFNQALDIDMKVRGPDDVEVANDRNNLALLYIKQRNYAEAQSQLQQALDIWKKNLGEENTTVADGLNNLAEVYRNQGKYTEAEPRARKALEIWEKHASAPDDPDLAPSLNILGMIYSDEGRYAEAEQLFKRALAIREKAFGPDHEKLAISLNGLAVVYHRQGKYTEAEQLFKRALAIREKALGPNHPDVAETLEHYAALLSDTRREAEATMMKARAKDIRDKHMNQDAQN
jgi:tetratricopeptide (TPR) repeat protein